MDYYIKKFNKLQDEFHETIEKYPLFSEMIDEIYDKIIPEIEKLLDKNDEYYLKKAISKLEDLIKYIQDTSTKIKNEYALFDKYANEWNRMSQKNTGDEKIVNAKIQKANELIQKHDLDSIKEANKIMENILKVNR